MPLSTPPSTALPRPAAPAAAFPGPHGGTARPVPGHDRWHPDIPAVAEVITGGSVRLECEDRADGTDAVLCGPLVVVGAEPGDVIAVDVLGVGRADGVYAPAGHPGVIGCAPAPGPVRPGGAAGRGRPGGTAAVPPAAPLLGRIRPGPPAYGRLAAEAVSSEARGREIGGCAIAALVTGSRILLPVHVPGAKLSAGDLHFPRSAADDCHQAALPGWIDLRVNLTRRGVERFRVTGPMLIQARVP